MVTKYCEICDRELGSARISKHHLIPQECGGKETIELHDICHAKIHHTFTNKELLHVYNTPQAIKQHEEMKKFIKWVSKKDPSFYDKNDDTKHRKSKRKR